MPKGRKYGDRETKHEVRPSSDPERERTVSRNPKEHRRSDLLTRIKKTLKRDEVLTTRAEGWKKESSIRCKVYLITTT